MPAPLYQVGTALRAARTYMAKTTARKGEGSYFNATSGQYENSWSAPQDDMVDINGRRSDVLRIVEPLPTTTSTFVGSRWEHATSSAVAVTKVDEYVYNVLVWDIDLGYVVAATYPESELSSGTQAVVHARHADLDRLPEDIAVIRRAYEVGGTG